MSSESLGGRLEPPRQLLTSSMLRVFNNVTLDWVVVVQALGPRYVVTYSRALHLVVLDTGALLADNSSNKRFHNFAISTTIIPNWCM